MMAHPLPPELLSPEERAERIEELNRKLGREWISYMLMELLLIGVPAFVVVGLWLAGSISNETAAILTGLGCVAIVVLGGYWVHTRIKPVGNERLALMEIERAEGR
jgi:hypothetical protein